MIDPNCGTYLSEDFFSSAKRWDPISAVKSGADLGRAASIMSARPVLPTAMSSSQFCRRRQERQMQLDVSANGSEMRKTAMRRSDRIRQGLTTPLAFSRPPIFVRLRDELIIEGPPGVQPAAGEGLDLVR